jgi:hypothetical protein
MSQINLIRKMLTINTNITIKNIKRTDNHSSGIPHILSYHFGVVNHKEEGF